MTSPLHPLHETRQLLDKLRDMLPTLVDRRAVEAHARERVGDYFIESEGGDK